MGYPRRRLGRSVFAFVLTAGSALSGVQCAEHLAPAHFIVGLAPVAEGRAVVLARNGNELWSPASSVGVFDARIGWLWRKPLPDPDEPWPWHDRPAVMARWTPRHEGVLVHEGKVIVRIPGDEMWSTGLVSAYALEGGALLWRTRVPGMGSAGYSVDLLPLQHRVVVGSHGNVAVLDMASGSILSTVEGTTEAAPTVKDPHMVTDGASPRVFDLRGDSGNAGVRRSTSLGDERGVCVEGSELLVLDTHRGAPRLLARGIETGLERVAVAQLLLPDDDPWRAPYLVACGRHAGRLFAMMSAGWRGSFDGIVEIDLSAGKQVAFTALKAGATRGIPNARSDVGTGENALFGGTLPRFHPILMADGVGEPSLAVFDFEAQAIVRRGRARKRLRGAAILKHDGGLGFTVLAREQASTTLARFDGVTGELTGAVCIEGDVVALKPFQIVGRETWVHTEARGMPFGILTGERLERGFVHGGLPTRDCRAEVRMEWLDTES